MALSAFSEALNNELSLISAAPLSLEKWKLHNGFLNQCCIYSHNLNLFIFWLGSVIVHLFLFLSSPFLLPLANIFLSCLHLAFKLCRFSFFKKKRFWVWPFVMTMKCSEPQDACVVTASFLRQCTFASCRFLIYLIAKRRSSWSLLYIWHFWNFRNGLYALFPAVCVW